VRLLDDADPVFPQVEDYFEHVVVQVVEDRFGFQSVQIGVARSRSPFINVEIFDRLAGSAVVVADLTGLRTNCFLELGYALGAAIPVIITAQAGTPLPFDSHAMPCCFWEAAAEPGQLQSELLKFWRANVGRASVGKSPVDLG
jgi:hypothetical protein